MVNLVWLLAQAAEDATVPSLEDRIAQWFASNFPLLAACIMVIVFVGSLLQSIDAIKDWSNRFFDKLRPKKQEITDEQRQELRRVVLRQIVKRLNKSLHGELCLDLERKEELQRVGLRTSKPVDASEQSEQFIHRELNPFDSPSPPVPIDSNISTYDLLARDDIKGRLLILGEPGSGKTNELLTVARALLQKESLEHPIPIIFELSEWSNNNKATFADWLSDQLKDKYNVSPDVSKHWLEQNQIFPLLDGLDELRRVDEIETVTSEEMDQKRQDKQIQCMRAINEFLDVYPATSMVVCCRCKEYETLETQRKYLKRLNGAICLKALDKDQIEAYCKQSNRESLWGTLNNQPKLLELARSPLFLLMFVVAYEDQTIQTTDELLDLYIDKQLNDPDNQGEYAPSKSPSKEDTHHYLSWLATKLEEQEVTEFLIERLQPSWLDRKRDLNQYKLLYGLIFGLIFGLIVGLSNGLLHGLMYGLIVGLFLGLLLRPRPIQPAESLSFSVRSALLFGLLFGLSGGLLVGLFGGLLVGPTGGLFGGLLGGLFGGLFGGLLGGLVVSESDIDDKQLPNQGIKRSIKTSIVFGLLGGLLFGLLGGLLGGLLAGLLSVIQHLSLRLVLHQSGVALWDYEKFLAYAENHCFIQRTGGRYRFVHALLRKRFAERYQPRYR